MKKTILMLLSAVCAAVLPAQTNFNAENIPLQKVTLYSSGVAHYEHTGTVTGSGKIDLLFSAEQINDVLKSLVITDPGAQNLSIDYQAENTLKKALESLKVNLSSSSSLYDILNAQRGAEIEIYTPNKSTGKILSVEKKTRNGTSGEKNRSAEEVPFLSLISDGKINIIAFSDIQSFKFTDEKRNRDLDTALNLILEASSNTRKQVSIKIDAKNGTARNISISYVMEAPVWKAGYRLNAENGKAAFQAWAIVDNSTDLDWKNIQLTLTTGRPVAFKQNLYQPYYTYRPEIPLMIAQAADPETFESGTAYQEGYEEADRHYDMAPTKEMAAPYAKKRYEETKAYSDSNGSGSNYFDNQTEMKTAGEMFAFTPAKPVNLERQKSTMIPLALVSIPAEKVSVFSSVYQGRTVNPKFCINIENTSGLKLPAGPVTVLDNGEYAGDALLDFLPEGEKRLIAYGDDIEVGGSKRAIENQTLDSVTIVDGVLTRKIKHEIKTQYKIKNSAKKTRTIIIEHPIRTGYELRENKDLTEKTANKYRFKIEAEAGKEKDFTVQEESLLATQFRLINTDDNFLISLQAAGNLPAKTKKTFDVIIKERQKLSNFRAELSALQTSRNKLVSEQERIRKNLEAFGTETQQGREFINKLLKAETELEELAEKTEAAETRLRQAEKIFKDYLNAISIE